MKGPGMKRGCIDIFKSASIRFIRVLFFSAGRSILFALLVTKLFDKGFENLLGWFE